MTDAEGAEQAARGARALPVAAPSDRRRRAARRLRSRYASLLRGGQRPPAGRPSAHEPRRPALIYFTSGTVAAPEDGAAHARLVAAGHELTARFWQDLRPADLHWTVSDTGWAKAAWGKLFGQWRIGASVFLWDQRGKLDPELCLRILERSGVTSFCAPPTLYRAFVQPTSANRPRRACATAWRRASRSTPK